MDTTRVPPSLRPTLSRTHRDSLRDGSSWPRLSPNAIQRVFLALGLAMVLVLLASFILVVRDHVTQAAESNRLARSPGVPAVTAPAPEAERRDAALGQQAYAK